MFKKRKPCQLYLAKGSDYNFSTPGLHLLFLLSRATTETDHIVGNKAEKKRKLVLKWQGGRVAPSLNLQPLKTLTWRCSVL